MTLKVIDRFTTRDGRWEVDDRPYGLTLEKHYLYRGWDIPGKGSATHLFVCAVEGSQVRFYTEDPTTPQTPDPLTVDETGWVNFPMWKSAAYWPPNQGPWCVSVNGVEVARGLGLPEGLHVSTFLIVDDVDDDSGSQPPNTPGKPVSHIQVIIDGVIVFDNWSE